MQPFLSEETQKFIVKIHHINEASQAFRYPFVSRETRAGNNERVFLVKAPPVPMGIFKEEFEIHASEPFQYPKCSLSFASGPGS